MIITSTSLRISFHYYEIIEIIISVCGTLKIKTIMETVDTSKGISKQFKKKTFISLVKVFSFVLNRLGRNCFIY